MNHALRITAAAAVLSVAAGPLNLASPQNTPGLTEVVLVGTIHQFQLLHPDNTPAHLRALLNRVRPDVIAVENPPDWQLAGRHLWTQLPEYYVAEKYGRENHIPVVGVADMPQLGRAELRAVAPALLEKRLRDVIDRCRRIPPEGHR